MRLDHITVSVPETLSSDVYSLKHHDEFPGDHGEAETHVPIPNTTVKRFIADGTAACPWESRSLPGFFLSIPLLMQCSSYTQSHPSQDGFFVFSLYDSIRRRITLVMAMSFSIPLDLRAKSWPLF